MSKDIIQNKYTAPDKVAGHDGDKLTRRWLKGIPYEIAFWRSFYSNKRRRAKLHSWSSIGKEWRLDGFDVAAFLQSRHIEPDSERCGEAGSVKNHVGDPERRGINFPSPRVLDVGASLSYVVGNVIGGRKYDVEYVDPLAPFYNRILERYNVDLPRISFGMIENLSASYGEESVDLIHVRNALDHCANPARGICECIATLKPGGVLYLHHHRNEAEAENYRGFHQFNIDCKDGRMLIWNAETCIYLDELLAGMADVECFTTPEGFIVGIAKNAPPPPPPPKPALS